MKNRKGFTLVEMLIVIVIIGILAAAILPNLLGARDKANDTARKSQLSNMIAPLTSYAGNKGYYPEGCGDLDSISGDLKNMVEKMPKDPNTKNTIAATVMASVTEGQYGYCAIKRNENSQSAFALVAKVSDTDMGNWPKNKEITAEDDYTSLLSGIQQTGEYLVILKA